MLKYLLGLKNPDEKPVFARIDLEQYLKEHTSTRNRQEEVETEVQIFQNALDFSKVKARECMVPRNEIVAMDINQPIDSLREKFIETGFSKIVIYRESIDQIVGYTHSYELFKQPESIKSILLPIAIVPESMTTNDILDLLIKERKSIALVLDEFGGTAGLITMEDVVEEIFGEIEDEYDNMALLEEKISDREYIFSGRHEVDYLNEKFHLNIPDSDNYETLSGLIVHYHEDIPEKGALITFEGFKFEILEVEQTRIEKLRLIKRS
jgi:CBS domain containing-hemolysin-like protein